MIDEIIRLGTKSTKIAKLQARVNELTAAIQKHKKEIELKIEGRIDHCPEDKSLWSVLEPEVSGTGIQDMMAEVEALSQEVSDG